MSEMVKTGSKYTDIQRKEAAVQYAITGLMSKVSTDLDIPESTLCQWKNGSDWWDKLIEEVRSEKADEHIALYHSLTQKALAKAEGAIDQLGDTLSASDIKALVVTGATATDKARLLLNQPTSIRADADPGEAIKLFLEQIADSYREKRINVVSTQEKEG